MDRADRSDIDINNVRVQHYKFAMIENIFVVFYTDCWFVVSEYKKKY